MYNIPIKVNQMNTGMFATFINDYFNYCIACGDFLDELKHAVTPVHEKNEVLQHR